MGYQWVSEQLGVWKRSHPRAVRGRQGNPQAVSGKKRLLAEGQGLLPCLPQDWSTGERQGIGWQCSGLDVGGDETAVIAPKYAQDQSFSVMDSKVPALPF